jgi:hypothetical protein
LIVSACTFCCENRTTGNSSLAKMITTPTTKITIAHMATQKYAEEAE